MDDCQCEPTTGWPGYDEPGNEGPTHFERTCPRCGCQWEALHCEHDPIQHGCPDCGWKEPGQRTPSEHLGFATPPGG